MDYMATTCDQVIDEKDSLPKKKFGSLLWSKTLFKSRPRKIIPEMRSECLKIKMIGANKFLDDVHQEITPYQMKTKHRGILLLINNIHFTDGFVRKGAEVDEANLTQLFTQLGFVVHTYRDQTLEEFKDLIWFFVTTVNSSSTKYDCCFVIVNSYGVSIKGKSGQQTHITTSDKKTIQADWLINMLGEDRFEAFIGKPKVILFNLSRGKSVDHDVCSGSAHMDDSIATEAFKLNTQTDMLIGYSTVPGYVSFRNINTGSWYIRILCEIFMQNAHDTDIEEMLRLVSMEVVGMNTCDGSMQTPIFENRNFRPCYLNPNIYLEDGCMRTITNNQHDDNFISTLLNE